MSMDDKGRTMHACREALSALYRAHDACACAATRGAVAEAIKIVSDELRALEESEPNSEGEFADGDWMTDHAAFAAFLCDAASRTSASQSASARSAHSRSSSSQVPPLGTGRASSNAARASSSTR